jgi:hypothetical protein
MNLNFDNKVWMFIFIIGFIMVVLASKCLCNNENFTSLNLDYGKENNDYVISYDTINNIYVLSSKSILPKIEPLKIKNDNIILKIDSKIKSIKELKEKLEKTLVLNMSYSNKSLLLHNFKKDDISLNKDNIIIINNAKFNILENN